MIITFIEKFLFRRPKKRDIGEALLIDLSAILIWRGVWGLTDLYFFPNHSEFSFVLSVVLGLTLMYFIRYFSKNNR